MKTDCYDMQATLRQGARVWFVPGSGVTFVGTGAPWQGAYEVASAQGETLGMNPPVTTGPTGNFSAITSSRAAWVSVSIGLGDGVCSFTGDAKVSPGF